MGRVALLGRFARSAIPASCLPAPMRGDPAAPRRSLREEARLARRASPRDRIAPTAPLAPRRRSPARRDKAPPFVANVPDSLEPPWDSVAILLQSVKARC